MSWWMSVVACVAPMPTERGQLAVEAPDLKTLGTSALPAPMLAGTRTCPTVSCREDCPTLSDPLACFDSAGTGSVRVLGSCWRFDVPGTGAVSWSTVPCAANGEGYAPDDDRLGFEVLAASDVTAAPLDLERLAEAELDPGPAGAFPTTWAHPPGAVWSLVSGSRFVFVPILAAPDGREVGWTLLDAVVEVVPIAGAPPATALLAGHLAVEIESGSTADLRFGVGTDRWPLATVSGVPVDAVRSLEVVVAYAVDPNVDTVPFAARAVARDASGNLVWGAPVTWSLDEGLLALGGLPIELPGPDYVVVADACTPPSENEGSHTAVLRATLGDLTDTVALAWDVSPGLSDDGFEPWDACVEGEPLDPGPTEEDPTPPASEPGFEPEPAPASDEPLFVRIVGGCGCDTGGAPEWLAVGLVFALRRRAGPPSGGRRGPCVELLLEPGRQVPVERVAAPVESVAASGVQDELLWGSGTAVDVEGAGVGQHLVGLAVDQ